MRFFNPNTLALVSISFFISSFASALSFHNPWTQARVLNPGQSHWRVDTTYEASHRAENVPVTQVSSTWAQLLKNSKTSAEVSALDAKRQASGQSLNETAAVTKYELYQETTTIDIAWSYGIYKKWMIGFDIPLVASTQEVKSESSGPQGAEVSATAQQQLNDMGIRADRTQYSDQRIGDVALLSQVQLASLSNWTFAFQQKLGIPTSTQPDERNLFMRKAGNSQPSLGGRLLATWQHKRRWQFNSSVGYLWQTKDQVRVRLPDENGNVSGDIETGVDRDLGDMYDAQAEGVWRTGAVDIVTGYRVIHKQADRYQGTFVDQSRYDELAVNSEWTKHLVSVGALYHIGRTQRAGVQDGYSVLVAGHWPLRDQAPLWSLDLRMMF